MPGSLLTHAPDGLQAIERLIERMAEGREPYPSASQPVSSQPDASNGSQSEAAKISVHSPAAAESAPSCADQPAQPDLAAHGHAGPEPRHTNSGFCNPVVSASHSQQPIPGSAAAEDFAKGREKLLNTAEQVSSPCLHTGMTSHALAAQAACISLQGDCAFCRITTARCLRMAVWPGSRCAQLILSWSV